MSRDVRLIDVDEAIEKINCLCTDSNENWLGTDNQSFIAHADVVDILSDMPTVEATEVQHGQWEHVYDDVRYHAKCTACGRTAVRMPTEYCSSNFKIKWEYCPNCGAIMDLEERE